MGKAAWGRGQKYMRKLYLPLNFAMNLKKYALKSLGLKIVSQKNLVKREILYIFFYKWKKISIDQITNQINNQNNKLLITTLTGR